MTLHDWNISELEKWDEQIRAIASSFGLTPYPVEFRHYNFEQMLDISAYHMPYRYQHWSFGKSYDVHRTMKRFELASLAYEMVVNTNPAQAFCWRDNSLPLHVLVMAHVYGHSDFFANNAWFKALTRPDNALEMFRAHADEIAGFREDPSIPAERLEELLDAAHALMFHRPRSKTRKRETLDQQRDRIIAARRIEPKEWDHLKPKSERERPALKLDKVPLEPDDDLLRFLSENAPLKDWERRVLQIVAEESDYFMPNIVTKVMNEGWATFWHDRIFHALSDKPPEFDVEYARRMADVVIPGAYRMNPYHIGWHIWRDIYRRWETPNEKERRDWGRTGGQGFEKLFEVRDTEDDASFLANYLTDELIAELKLYRYDWVGKDFQGKDVYVVTNVPDSGGFEQIRREAARQVGHNMFPMILVEDCQPYGGRVLHLRHVQDGRDLDLFDPPMSPQDAQEYATKKKGRVPVEYLGATTVVLEHIRRIWGNSVELETRYGNCNFRVCRNEEGVAILV